MQNKNERIWVVLVSLVALLSVAFVLMSAGVVGVAAADNVSNKTGYYDNTTPVWDNSSWIGDKTNATLDDQLDLLTRFPGFIIGGDSATGAALIMGLIVFGGVMSMSSGSRLGIVGGGVAGTLTTGALVAANLAPAWAWAMVLAVIGLIAVSVWVKPFR